MTQTAVSVLAVDDRQDVGDALRRTFTSRDFHWDGWLENADHLIEHVKSSAPDVVILDIAMPGLDPLAALRQLTDQCPETKVIVFTALMSRKVILDAITAGASGVLLKDDSAEQLIAAVRSVAQGGFVISKAAQDLAGLH